MSLKEKESSIGMMEKNIKVHEKTDRWKEKEYEFILMEANMKEIF